MTDHETTQVPDAGELASLFRYTSRLMARTAHSRHGERSGGPGRPGRHEQGPHAQGRHAQGKVLALLRKTGPVAQGELLEILDVRSSSLSELLSKLERAGLVKRERNPDDRRSFIVSATPESDALLDERKDQDSEVAEHLFACLDDTERTTLHAVLTKLAEALKDAPEAGDCRRGLRGRRVGPECDGPKCDSPRQGGRICERPGHGPGKQGDGSGRGRGKGRGRKTGGGR